MDGPRAAQGLDMLRKLVSDFRGIARVCGIGPALRWLGCVALTMPANLKTRNLLAADLKMGNGPFAVHHKVGDAKLVGEYAFSGLREIWVRDVYARDGFVQIPDHGTVVDLGANMGNFSAMALAASPTARLIAVEPSTGHAAKWRETMRVNGFTDRAELCQAFVGTFTDVQRADFAADPAYAAAPIMSEREFLDRYRIDRIDFLKCDIEGSEFFMMEPGSTILDIAQRIAIEVHDFGGDVPAFLANLKARGFTDIAVDWYGGECIARASRAPAMKMAA